jgi:hypothetical protein
LRWLIWAGSINLVTAMIPESVAPLPIAVVNGLAIVLLAASIGVAISRYRLYEIDRVIRRTFIYAFVTGILAVSYAGLVLLIGMASPLGSDSPIAVAVATLAVAGLFRPLRLLVQKSIDRYSTELVTTLSVHWSSSATGCERTSTSTRWGPS